MREPTDCVLQLRRFLRRAGRLVRLRGRREHHVMEDQHPHFIRGLIKRLWQEDAAAPNSESVEIRSGGALDKCRVGVCGVATFEVVHRDHVGALHVQGSRVD